MIDKSSLEKRVRHISYVGKGPEDKRCKHCAFFYEKVYSKKYFKCLFRGNTNGPGTDHKANWPTC